MRYHEMLLVAPQFSANHITIQPNSQRLLRITQSPSQAARFASSTTPHQGFLISVWVKRPRMVFHHLAIRRVVRGPFRKFQDPVFSSHHTRSIQISFLQ